jgi:enamine deaminase RidA (YjgF/YER057c/UK114 family)
MSKRRVIQPPAWPTPPGYSHAVATARPLIFVSGQVPLDAAGALVGGADFEAQTAQVFENLRTVLAGVGASFDDVVKLTYFVVGLDGERLAAVRRVRDRHLGDGPRPASSLLGVAALFRPDVLIEIEAIAELPTP